jgi:hypothetical protein
MFVSYIDGKYSMNNIVANNDGSTPVANNVC